MSIMRVLAIVALFPWSVPLLAQGEQAHVRKMMDAYKQMTQVDRPCPPPGQDGAIVVCARVRDQGQYRLPLKRERSQDAGGIIAGEVPRAATTPVRIGSCGVVGREGGCTGGLPVIPAAILVAKALVRIVKPDAVDGPPPPLPARYRGAGEH